jgi:acetyl-CoA carboxylase biotin carboxyl carrier protein
MDGRSDIAGYLAEGLPLILDALSGSDVAELILQEGNVRLRICRTAEVGGLQAVDEISIVEDKVPRQPGVIEIVSPLVGTFYRAEKPGMPALVVEGTPVSEDTVVGIVEALHVLTEVVAGCAGIIKTVLVTDGVPVQYGQVMFEVEPRG